MKHDSTHRYEHTDARGTLIEATVEKDTSTNRSALYAKKKTISFIYFNFIKAYVNWIKSNLDSNYKTKVKQIIFCL